MLHLSMFILSLFADVVNRRKIVMGLVLVIGATFVAYLLTLSVCRLFFCPQKDIPGPILAKLTFWYEFYYDVVLGGQYIWKIRQLHEQYGSIIRINPEEVHIQDADFYDQVYAGASHKRNKWSFFTNQSGLQGSAFATEDHNLHRMRRGALNPYFSKAKVRSLQPRIEAVLQNLLGRFQQFAMSGEPMTVSLAYAALTNDIVMEYAFASSDERVLAVDFDPSFKEAGEAGAKLGHLVKQMPWLLSVMKVLPDSAQLALNPVMASYIKLNQDVIRHVVRVRDQLNDPDAKSNTQTTVFHDIMNGDLPESEKTVERLWQDGQVTVIAGTLTTAAALSEITYHLLSQPKSLLKLKQELSTVVKDPKKMPDSAKLENLPYLTAVIKEGLRLSSGISARLQRIATEETLIYTSKPSTARTQATKRYVLPPGIPLSMTGLLIHHSSNYFDEPKSFKPERFIDDPALDKYLVPFSRGTRACVGINLAHTELYLTIGSVFSQYGSKDVQLASDRGWLDLFETTYDDLEIIGDGTTPLYRPGSNGVRIKVHSV